MDSSPPPSIGGGKLVRLTFGESGKLSIDNSMPSGSQLIRIPLALAIGVVNNRPSHELFYLSNPDKD